MPVSLVSACPLLEKLAIDFRKRKFNNVGLLGTRKPQSAFPLGAKMAATTEPLAQSPQLFGREWFPPGLYLLDLSPAADLPMKVNGDALTFAEVYRLLRDSKVQGLPEHKSGAEMYKTALRGTLVVEEDTGLTMHDLAELMSLGIDPQQAMWFYYDRDLSKDGDLCHIFFVVHGGAVVLEACRLSSEAPAILKKNLESDPIWSSHRYFADAFERYWYRKFYAETTTGQLMVLRADEPTFPRIRGYMGVVAVVMLIEVLWLCWRTRGIAG